MFEFDSFNEYFRIVWAESILKKFVDLQKDIPVMKLLVSLNISEKRLLSTDELLDSFLEISGDSICSDSEWEVLNSQSKVMNNDYLKGLRKKKWY